LMMSLWDALRMNMMISYQELVRTFLSKNGEKSSDSNFTLSELLIRNIPNSLSGEMKLKKS
ncbi:hypothetical protein POV92_15810, partial [Enterobacter roggenkampii]|uniref:hypothetical protein n=1 Tax=Enterobacter roggenkampii TaxID=1812935 RepID=UPI002FFA6913